MRTVAIFTQNLSAGGVQKSVITLANHFKNIFKIVIILCESDKDEFYKFENILKINSVKIDINKSSIGQWLIEYRTNELDKILSKLKPDLLISFEDYNNIIALKTKFKCKKVISSRVSFSGNYDNKIHLLDKNFYIKNIKNLYSNADYVICVSKFIQKELMDLGIKAYHIYNGITINPKINNPKKNFIINLGRLHPQKGQKDLIKAYSLIKDDIKEDLFIIGDGVLKLELQSLIQSLNLENRVKLTGFINPKDYINECKMAIMPSYYEGFSNSVLEIMAAKKAVLAYDYDGADEIFDKNDLIKKGDIAALSLKLKEILNSPQILNDLETKQWGKVKEFDIKTTMQQYENLIAKVLKCAE
ncbi:glycosyltransferase [Campylobacter fetus]|uniref:Glycosyl transferase, group 1 n=2 Tax=Campylobacter fetus TaxID=196 RepID=A0RRB2_CAMFF|nr:glycosyltransferase [Campylobacter fetus]ABK81853.1 glycosyl transferase, group 1 [Campylobacter fetus subsp. fetus 82-40]EAI3887040.1 glycosyltransferase [Campylobacter fetus]EAI3916473.1 glycosyltransferase [Campylobacter fetus]EAI3919834.1 glycosyltransferase [Campylobacter fetus]EAI8859522.1 glycosyltransferase [Campylobacter fetus]